MIKQLITLIFHCDFCPYSITECREIFYDSNSKYVDYPTGWKSKLEEGNGYNYITKMACPECK